MKNPQSPAEQPAPAITPAPADDGGGRHLPGMRLPELALASTGGKYVNLARLRGLTVIYVYPMTGRPGTPLPQDWDSIPGARGCTPQSCAFRDHFAGLQALGVAQLFGLSVQDTAYQREAAERLHLPFPLLSDKDLALTRALSLPVFAAGGQTLLRRLTLIARDDRIEQVFYPVCLPDQNAAEVMQWLQHRACATPPQPASAPLA
ncbi:peroxiredoxin [Kerstersia sp.]|uniref:peroxiredoxin n=1 Tax=Kerstersia sp. TaxID=1930783 RepID=UPI003F8F3086